MSVVQKSPTDDITALFETIKTKFPQALGEDKWYLVAISALVWVEPDHVGTLYTYLINRPQFESPESRKILVRRMREVLIKCCILQGVPKCIQALLSIVKVEKSEDKDYSSSREHWQSGPDNYAKGTKWLKVLYRGENVLAEMPDIFAAHKDFDFFSGQITYGLCLSDHSIIDPIETELVTLTSIMIQNVPTQTGWHLRAIRRLGVEKDDVELVHQCVELVAKFGGISLNKIPRVAEFENQVQLQV